MKMIEIAIDSEFIKLDQFLKLVDIASTGGHAKFLIQEGLVKVNGEIETRRGKKLRSNDIVEVEGNTIKIL
jgi:ribosome-associated protein